MKFNNTIKRLEGVWFIALVGSIFLLAFGVKNDLSSTFFAPAIAMFSLSITFMIIAHKTN